MSLRALFPDAATLLSTKHGVRWPDPVTGEERDSGVEKFAQELVTYLMSRKPIKLNSPLIFEYSGADAPMQFRLADDNAGPVIHVTNEKNETMQLGIGGESEGIVANELVLRQNFLLDQSEVNNIYNQNAPSLPGPGEPVSPTSGPDGAGFPTNPSGNPPPGTGVPGGSSINNSTSFSFGVFLNQIVNQGGVLAAVSLNADLVASGSAGADLLNWNGSAFADTGTDITVQGTFINGKFWSGDTVNAVKFGDTYFALGTGRMHIFGKLDAQLNEGSSANLSVYQWNGAAFADTGNTETVHEQIGLNGGNIASGENIKASWMSVGEIWLADAAEK